MEFVQKEKTREVPNHLKNAPTKFMQNQGISKKYRYPHDEPYGYAAAEKYLPDGLESFNWYKPNERGIEIKIKEKLSLLKELDKNFKKTNNI